MPIDSSTTPLVSITGTPTTADFDGNNSHFTERVDREAAFSAQYAYDHNTTTGLLFAYYGGTVRDTSGNIFTTPAGTVSLANNATNYVEVDTTDGTVSVNQVGWSGGTKWPLWQAVTASGVISSATDARPLAADGGGGGSVTDVTGSGGITSTGGTTPDLSLTAGGTDDTAIGDRTIDDTLATPASTGTLTQLLSWIGGIIKGITGKTNWYDAPDTDLATAATHIAAAAPHSGHLKADGTVAMAADLDLGGNKVVNAADGVASTDLATVGQLATAAAGFAPRPSVRVATVVALPANTRSSETLTASANGSINATGIDGITNLAIGDRVLVKNEATGANNGVYEVDAVGSAGVPWSMTRATDFDSSGEATLGAYYPVREGATNGATAWYLDTQGSITLDTTALTFSRDPRGSGETNTASNDGASGTGVFDSKTGVNLSFRNLASVNGLLTIALDAANKVINFTVNEASIAINNLSGTLGATKGGTGLTAATLGDLIYASATNVWSRLAGNGTTTRKFLMMVSGIPSWITLLGNDIPVFGPAGAGHSKGGLPDPGATARNDLVPYCDGTWREIPATGLSGTSSTPVTVPASLGVTKTWLTQAGKAFVVGMHVRGARTSDPAGTYIGGTVTAYDGVGNLSVTVDEYAGSGVYTDWTISINGAPGVAGANGTNGANGQGVPVGGTTHQVLRKIDGTDYNTEWHSLGDAADKNTGTTTGTVAAGDDSRFTDARTPTAHHTTHESGGTDVIPHQNLSGAGTNTHAQIDTHIANTSNPHSVTAAQVAAWALSVVTALGDLAYASASGTIARLAGNTTTTKKFLTQTGTGSASAAPSWGTIAAADVPVMVASGASHAPGAVPDPPSTSGSTKFLREDATWAVPSGSSGALVQIAQTVVGVGGAAAVTFSSIAGTYTDLEVSVFGRTDNAVTSQSIAVQLGNGSADTGGNYEFQYVQGGSTSAGAGEGFNQSSIPMNILPGASATAGRAGALRANIFSYASTVFQKVVLITGGYFSATSGSGNARLMTGMWASTSAVDTVKVFPTAGNFAQGSVITLWGRS